MELLIGAWVRVTSRSRNGSKDVPSPRAHLARKLKPRESLSDLIYRFASVSSKAA